MLLHPMVSAPSVPAAGGERVCSPWLAPVVEEAPGQLPRRAWPAPALAPLDAPEWLRRLLLDGLLLACQRELERRRSLPPGAAQAARRLNDYTRVEPGPLPPEDLRRSTSWLIWLLGAGVRLALGIALAPPDEPAETLWQAALKRQTALAGQLAQVVQLYQEVAQRQGSQAALTALETALARASR